MSGCCGEPAKNEQGCCHSAEETAVEQGCACGCNQSKMEKWMTGYTQTPEGRIPVVSAKLKFSDTWGTWKARWTIGRMHYTVSPGLYAIGEPDKDAPVLVTANYKMTFDKLRRELLGLNLWIMVLDTKGINVWCAAGKGTFGTEEIIRRIKATGLANIVSHRNIILPQLGGPGVEAHTVRKESGFKVIYGPVRARDIRAFLEAGCKATKEMRAVRFTTVDRLVLTPVEVVSFMKPTAVVFGVLFILNALGFGHYGITDLYAWIGAILIGCVIAPVLLPWIPGRAFSFKGLLLGLVFAVGVNFINGWPGTPAYGWLKAVAYLLILPSVSAYATLNYTGTSTYTSLSGVDREMRIALPAMIIAVFCGIVLLIVNDITRLSA